MHHVYLSDRLFVALVKRLGLSRQRLRALRARQERQLRKGVKITLFSTARLEGLLDSQGAARLVGYARRAIRRHPKYRRDLVEVRGPSRRSRSRQGSQQQQGEPYQSLDAYAEANARSVERLCDDPPTELAPTLAPGYALPPGTATVAPGYATLGYQASPLRAEPIRGTESVDIASLLRGAATPPPRHPSAPRSGRLIADDSPFGQNLEQSFDSGSGFGVHSEVGRDVSGIAEDSSLFAVADWNACADYETDPFAESDPFAASADPFAASADPFAPTSEDPFTGGIGYQDPFAAAASGNHSDPFAAAAASFNTDPFAAAAAQAGPPADWLGRDSAEFDPFGPSMS